MLDSLTLALQITVVGMSLVFGAIILLWGVMALLMRLTARLSDEEASAEVVELELKQKAAVAAVMVALEREAEYEPHEFPLPPAAIVSAWQAVMRTKMLNKRGPVR